MNAIDLFNAIEKRIPPDLALPGDRIGYIGSVYPDELDVNRILVFMDYTAQNPSPAPAGEEYDLLVLHHPPFKVPEIPAYVIHSNWDVVSGGACDALAECLNVEVTGLLDEKTGIGRIGKVKKGPVPVARFVREVMINLRLSNLRTVNCRKTHLVERICLVSGFGLNPEYIQMAAEKGADLFVSGDLTHQGAIVGKNLGITLIDASHYATEFPGLCRLGEYIASLGPDVQVRNTGIPWMTSSLIEGGRRYHAVS